MSFGFSEGGFFEYEDLRLGLGCKDCVFYF